VNRLQIELKFPEKLYRFYGVWWDIINTGLVVFLLFIAFFWFGFILVTGKLELLLFREFVWKQFIDTVPPEKQSEIGVSVLGVTVSGASAAALYLVRVGTSRWAINRRVGIIQEQFAEAIFLRCSAHSSEHSSLAVPIAGFLQASIPVFDHVGECHAFVQLHFERARSKCHLFMNDPHAENIDAIEIAIELSCSAMLAKKSVSLPGSAASIQKAIQDCMPKRS
jgi:hypothetical protein